MAFKFEECWILVGERRGALWLGRRLHYAKGRPAEVAFDGRWALRREEGRGDVLGWLHTHPPGHLRPSGRDVRTMRAWSGAFGKPLLCVIVSDGKSAAFRFDGDESDGVKLAVVECFDKDLVVGVDEHGG